MFGQRILLLIPHPDDEVVGCAAAIARGRARGATLFGAYLTTGVPAAEQLWPWHRSRHADRVAERQAEAERAAELLALQRAWFQGIPTRQLKERLAPTHERIAALLRELGADQLWAPAYEGGHQDHDATNFLASTFRDHIEVWEFSEYNFAGGRVRSQEFPAPNGTERELALESDERKKKRDLLRIYRSEAANLRHIATDREVFRPLADYDYSHPPHPGKLFYQRYQWAPWQSRVDYCQPEEVCDAIRRFTAAQPTAAPRSRSVSGA